MSRKKDDDNADILTDSDGNVIDSDGNIVDNPDDKTSSTGDNNQDSRESIADRIAAQREEINEIDGDGNVISEGFNNLDDVDDPEDGDDPEDDDPETGDDDPKDGDDPKDDDPKDSESVATLVVNGQEKKLTQAELVTNAQLYYGARQKMTEAGELTKKLTDGLADVARLQAELKAAPAKQDASPKAKAVDFNPEEFVKKLREGEDDEALEAVKQLTSMISSGTVEVPDVSAIVQEKLDEIEANKESEARALEDAKFDEAEANFKLKFANEISSSDDFFELATMEDKKLAVDPEWSTKPVDDRLAEAGNRAKGWLDLRASSDASQKRQKQKERHAPRRAATKRADIGRDKQPESRQSVIAEMKASRGQTL